MKTYECWNICLFSPQAWSSSTITDQNLNNHHGYFDLIEMLFVGGIANHQHNWWIKANPSQYSCWIYAWKIYFAITNRSRNLKLNYDIFFRRNTDLILSYSNDKVPIRSWEILSLHLNITIDWKSVPCQACLFWIPDSFQMYSIIECINQHKPGWTFFLKKRFMENSNRPNFLTHFSNTWE